MANKAKSVITLKCPRCGEGHLFKNKNVYKFNGFFDMEEECSSCCQDFQIEPGFYYGSMYVSYGFTIAITVAVLVAMNVLGVFSIVGFLIADVITLIVTLPYVFKVSRAFWLSLIVKPFSKGVKES